MDLQGVKNSLLKIELSSKILILSGKVISFSQGIAGTLAKLNGIESTDVDKAPVAPLELMRRDPMSHRLLSSQTLLATHKQSFGAVKSQQ